MDKAKILQQHLEYKKTSVHSKEKLKDIERYLNAFLNSSKKPLDKFTEEDLAKFINSLQPRYSIQTANQIKVFIKVFLKWHFADYSSRFRNLDRICKTQKAPKTHTADEMLDIKQVEKLINAENELMWKTFMIVYFYGGFRPSECAKLRWDQVLFQKEGIIIKVFSDKNKKTFYKSLPESAEHYIKEWKKLNDSQWVFPSPLREDKPVARKTFYFRLVKLSKKVLGKPIFPYLLRHSIATIKYADDNLKEDDVASQMGHSKSMKGTYLNLSEEQIMTRARKIYAKIGLPPEKQKDLLKVVISLAEIMLEEKLGKITEKQFAQKLYDLHKELSKKK